MALFFSEDRLFPNKTEKHANTFLLTDTKTTVFLRSSKRAVVAVVASHVWKNTWESVDVLFGPF